MKRLIYAADDDADIRRVMEMFLGDAGLDLRLFESADELLRAFEAQPCDLVILDVMMPGTDGISACAALRRVSSVPIIILTARESEMDHAAGFSAGSDDYIIKPFRPSLLVMKVKALLRRVEMAGAAASPGELRLGDLSYLDELKLARCRGQDIPLTLTELKLLKHMMAGNGRACSREALLQSVWGFETAVETRVVDETVRRLRAKLQQVNCQAHIKTVWGYGYRLMAGGEQP